MCTPMAIAGVALSIGSTVANTIAANKVDKARADAMATERMRQSRLDQENAALNETSRERYTDFGGQQEESASKLGDYFTENEASAAANNQQAVDAMLPTSGSEITVQEVGKQSNLAKAFTDQQGQALGKLRSFGEVLGGIGRLQARDAGTVGQINSFKRASSGIVPLELEAANSAGAGARMFGDILGAAGSMALNGGLKGGPGVNFFPSVPTRPMVSSGGLF